MIGAIPNPKKSIDVDFSIDKIINTIEYIPLKNNKYKFTSKNEVLKTYRFEALEFLSLGVFIDINLSSISESKTKIDIEVLRKVGAFDKSYEVSKANEHITAITTLISQCIILTPEEIEQLAEQKQNNSSKQNSGCGKSAGVLLIAIFIAVSSMFLV